MINESQVNVINLKDSNHWVKSYRNKLFPGVAGKGKINASIPNRSIQVLPGMYSTDDRYQSFLSLTVDALNSELTGDGINFDKSGFASETMLVRDFSAAKCVAGVGSTPTGRYLVDNAELRKSIGLDYDYELMNNQLLKAIVSEVVRLFFGTLKFEDLLVSNKSSSGAVHLSYTSSEKQEIFRKLLPPLSKGDLFKALKRNDGLTLLDKYDLAVCYLQNYRLQPEVGSKDRLVPDMRYAISGGKDGSLVKSNKDLQNPYGLSACRTRQIYGMTNSVNLTIAIWVQAASKGLFDNYPKTYKHRTPTEVAKHLRDFVTTNGGVVAGSDVSSFDQSQPSWLYDLIFDAIRSHGFISDDYLSFIRYTLSAPVFQAECGDGLGPCFIGDPIKMDVIPSPGMPSGNYLVAHLNKCCKCIDTMFRLFSIDKSLNLSDIDQILRWEHPKYAFKNAGDDELNILPSDQFATSFFETRSVFKVKREQGIKFLGVVYYPLSHYQSEHLGGINDIVSFITNTFVPERSYGSNFRKFAHIGLKAKFEVYGKHPLFNHVMDIVNFHMKMMYGSTFSYFVEKWILEGSNFNLNSADALFIDKPERLHYMLDPMDLTPEILSEEYNKFPIDECSEFIKNHINA